MDSSCRRCALWAEHAYKNLDDRQKYFLVSMKGDFQQAMTIPGGLLECLRGGIPAQITLETQNRNSSTIGVAKYPDKVVFSAGWATFVDTFDLHTDGSMMFRYTGDSQFLVIIFDQFGCEEPLSVLEDYACLPPRDPERHIDATGTTKCCDNCKELDEYKYHNLNNEEKYFLVALKGDSRHEMTVPEEFVRYFSGEFPGEIKLEIRNGYSYPVGVAKCPDKVVFSAGWEAFVKANDLHMDDSMVFRYIGNFQFNAIIFGRVGCEKASSVVVSSALVPLHVLKRCRDGTETMSHAYDHPETVRMGSLPRKGETRLHTDSTSQGNQTMPNFPATCPDSSGQPLFTPDVLQVPPQLHYIVARKSHLSDNKKKES